MEDIRAERPAHVAREGRPDLTKDQAVRRARTWKRALGWSAVLAFALLWQAAAHHLTGVTSRTGAGPSSSTPAQAPGSGQGFGQGQPAGGFDFGSSQSVQPFTQSTVS